MKPALITLSVAVAFLLATVLIQRHRIDKYKLQNEADRELFQFQLKKAVVYERLRVTDSLTTYYKSLPPVIETIEVIKWKHAKRTDSILKLSDSLKIEFIKSQLP
jgi:ABC-type transport system involved in Fe-S cluster assembly fused permease/ATPase subunit